MRLRGWFVAMMMLGGTACGPMPGYQRPHDEAPPAPTREPSVGTEQDEKGEPLGERDGQETLDDGQPGQAGDRDQAEDIAGEQDPPTPVPEPSAPRPPRYAPPKNWEEPKPEPGAPKRPAPGPEPTAPGPSDAIRIVRLDADSYYLIDTMRSLCFLRHKESMTEIDCARIPEAGAAAPRDERARGGPRGPSPSREELTRFEAAFTEIYCDRKQGGDTEPEARIREHGLKTERYEAIESWWAGDEDAWYTLTTRASKACAK